MKKIRTLLMVLSVLVFCAQASANLIVNGNFEAGNSGFTSQYAFQSDLTSDIEGGGAGGYNIAANPQASHPSWVSFYDHTSGTASGHMLVANGSLTGTKIVWTETVSVKPHTQYVFSYWLASSYPDNLATIRCLINGTPIGDAPAPPVGGGWINVSYVWNSDSNCKAVIRLVDTNTQYNGNDFAIDDIVFSAKPIAVIWGPCMGMAGCVLPFLGCGSYDPDGCIVLYQWDWGDGNTSPGMWAYHAWANPGTYTVTLTVTDKDGVTGTASITIKIMKKC
jgi:hypothetical protein